MRTPLFSSVSRPVCCVLGLLAADNKARESGSKVEVDCCLNEFCCGFREGRFFAGRGGIQRIYLPDGRMNETVAKLEELSGLWKPGAMDGTPPFVMNCKCI